MRVRPIISALMADAGITALVGNRTAMAQLPQSGSHLAQLEYNIISDMEEPEVRYNGRSGVLCRARVQFNPWALGMGTVEQIHAALRNVINFKHRQTIGGKILVSARVDLLGPAAKDNDAGLWTQPVDYMFRYYD